jgi:hypothetical protein
VAGEKTVEAKRALSEGDQRQRIIKWIILANLLVILFIIRVLLTVTFGSVSRRIPLLD